MLPMPGEIAAVSFAWSVCVWVLSGWSPADWRRMGRALSGAGERVQAELRAVLHVARSIVPRLISGSAEVSHATLGEVSEMIDVVRLGLSAGLSFDAALEMYCDARDTALSKRMKRALLSWRMGTGTREDELMAVARDMGVRALESFAVSVGQALALGAPLTDTLAGQSREIRAAHRAAVEREIERAPVKLIIPTGTLILPALLLSILGPLLAAGGMM